MKNKKTLFAVGAGIITGIGALIGIKKAIDKKNTEEILYSEADLEACECGCACEEEISDCCNDQETEVVCDCGCGCSDQVEPTENVHTEDTCCGGTCCGEDGEACGCESEEEDK